MQWVFNYGCINLEVFNYYSTRPLFRLSQNLITCGHDSLIRFWDLQMLLNQQNISLQKFSEKRDQCVQYSQDGQKLYVQMNGKLVVYDPFTGQESDSFKLELDKFVVRPYGKQIIYHTKQCKTYLYDLVLKQEKELKIKAQKILTQSNDGKLFFYQKFETQSVFYLVIFDESNLSMKQQSQEIKADFWIISYDIRDKGSQNQCGWSSQNQYISQGKFLLKYRRIINFQFTKDCKKLVLLDIDYKLYVWDTVLQKDISDLGKGQQNIQIQLLTMYLLIFEEDYIVVFDTQKYKQVGIKLQGHKIGIQQQVISPSGLQFHTVGKDNAIKVWDLNKQETNLTKAFIERLIIPQQMNQNALVNNCDFKECEIISHSGYNLDNIWAEE